MTKVQGKWALITGASRGVGYLTAIEMAKAGCNLVLHSRNTEHTIQVVEDAKAFGVQAYSVAAELSDPDQVDKMLNEIDVRGTTIDMVFNNAGLQVAYREDPFTTPVQDFTTSFMVNTVAPTMICYHFFPSMIARGFGRIINTTSGIQDQPQQAGYSASKAALDKITTDLATIVQGSDIIISLTDPGWCRTDLGGPQAPNPPESAIPGVLLGAFVNDRKSARFFHAQDYVGLTLEEAVKKAENTGQA
jgi:short-subunit dehydrogenase